MKQSQRNQCKTSQKHGEIRIRVKFRSAIYLLVTCLKIWFLKCRVFPGNYDYGNKQIFTDNLFPILPTMSNKNTGDVLHVETFSAWWLIFKNKFLVIC